MRATAYARALGQDPLSASAVRGPAQGARPQGARRDRLQTALYLSLCGVAGGEARHSTQVSRRASVQSAAAAAARNRRRLRARGGAADLPFCVARWASRGFAGRVGGADERER